MTAGVVHERKGEKFPCAGVVTFHALGLAGSGLRTGWGTVGTGS